MYALLVLISSHDLLLSCSMSANDPFAVSQLALTKDKHKYSVLLFDSPSNFVP